MNLQRLDSSREGIPDLLTRPPTDTAASIAGWSHLFVDPVQQLETLADLYTSGLLSRAEFERYKRQVESL